ncbi:ADP-ribosylglycohydrolase [Crossiella equi]|uniref:ADP-ribosylglycohydrolase n=1 Tax=Crossiella equi TaxID=130796 RepID=A0ABS5AP87_9PSEU|nr:ADP-ribosylglycohydrolase family protein [Crossiella equi]MBP2478355.1 ADP-ribosylglycohydrolase [Crossiella equi]
MTHPTDPASHRTRALHALTGLALGDVLAENFADHHDFDRGYGPAMNRPLRKIHQGSPWRQEAESLFDGKGSWGNGAAMRAAPLGAWHATNPTEAARQAARRAEVTHTHPAAIAGAMAIAVARARLALFPSRVPDCSARARARGPGCGPRAQLPAAPAPPPTPADRSPGPFRFPDFSHDRVMSPRGASSRA